MLAVFMFGITAAVFVRDRSKTRRRPALARAGLLGCDHGFAASDSGREPSRGYIRDSIHDAANESSSDSSRYAGGGRGAEPLPGSGAADFEHKGTFGHRADFGPQAVFEPDDESAAQPLPPPGFAKETAFEKFAASMSGAPKPPVIALIIDDMGVDMIRSAQILELPFAFDTSFLTYAPNLQAQIDRARSKGKEAMLHIPMEAFADTYDYGPAYLSTRKSVSENVRLFNSMAGGVKGIIGVNNHMGSKFTTSDAHISAIIKEAGKLGLAFVDSMTAPGTKTRKMALSAKVPYAARDVFLDDSSAEDDIRRELGRLEATARRRGYAVAIGHPRPNTIRILKEWMDGLAEKGISIVPLSHVIRTFGR
jgi:polysaccharide deacetylase 2 family uncharacterized protein YibQ